VTHENSTFATTGAIRATADVGAGVDAIAQRYVRTITDPTGNVLEEYAGYVAVA